VSAAPCHRRYNSTSYYDDMTWAATWMYQATKQPTYLNDAISYYVLHSQVPFCTSICLPAVINLPSKSAPFRASTDATVLASLPGCAHCSCCAAASHCIMHSWGSCT
jgi:Glycosyl hydrolase family 9